MDVAVTMFSCQRLAMLHRIIINRAMKNNLGPHSLHSSHLARIRSLWNHNTRLHAKKTCCVGHRLPVVSCRGCDHAPFSFVRAELSDQIDTSPNFESPDWL